MESNMIGANQNCELKPIADTNFYGEKTFSANIPQKVRVKEEYQLVKNQANEDVVSKLQFSFDGDSPVQINKYWIVYDGEEHRIISVSPKRNILGEVVYKKVYV